MSRPALSATRGIEIIDVLATFPERSFTLSEIARATNINIASCHAVLTALTERGYLVRSATRRGFSLGPSLVAVGQAALKSQPLTERSMAAGERLARELGLSVLLSAQVGDDIMAVLSLPDAAGRHVGMGVGERLPLVAPVGTPFLAWSTAEAVEAWIDRRKTPLGPELREELKNDLRLTRQRGYQISLRGKEGLSIGALINGMAASRQVSDYKAELADVIEALDSYRAQPEVVEDEARYDVLMIAAPIFDQDGEAKFNLCLGGLPRPVAGATLSAYADRLMEACLDVMHEDRGPRR